MPYPFLQVIRRGRDATTLFFPGHITLIAERTAMVDSVGPNPLVALYAAHFRTLRLPELIRILWRPSMLFFPDPMALKAEPVV
jgi:hypothetical protein